MKKPVRPIVVSLVSLGCAKNTVDSERILGRLVEAGFLISADPAEADICLVNTCGFIHDAREESAATLRELAKLRQNGQLKARVSALENENASLKAQLLAAGIKPKK